MTQSTGDIEPHDGIDPYNNPETRAAEAAQTTGLGRSTDDAAPVAPPASGDDAHDGTSGGNPLEGVILDEESAAEAVSGDTGPEHPGTRRSS